MAGILITNFDFSKMFLSNLRSQKGTYTNSTGADLVLPKGRLLGRVTASGKVLPHVSTASDGSQQPVGILMDDYAVANGATINLYFADGGDVAEEGIIFAASESLVTVQGAFRLRDLIAVNTNIKLVASRELSDYDNG